MVNIAIAGGSGSIGRTLAEVLEKSPDYQVFILSRKADPQSKAVLSVSYDDVACLKDTLEKNEIQTVISAFPLETDVAGAAEIALIKAADASKTTLRFITSSWAVPLPDAAASGGWPNYPQQSVDAARATGLEYTTIYVGCFMDYFGIPNIKSYLNHIDFGIDIGNKFAAIPGTGNEPFVVTYSFDIAKAVEALLGFESGQWSHETWVKGDRVTFNEILAAAEDARGVKFDVRYDNVEKLNTYQVTGLPSHKTQRGATPEDQFQMTLAWSGLMVVDGGMNFSDEKTINMKVPSLRTKTLKELVDEAWRGK